VSMGQIFGQNGTAADGGVIRLNEEELRFKALVDKRNARLAEMQRKQNESLQRLGERLNDKLAGFVDKGAMSISQNARGVTLDINASMLFLPGEASLQAEAVATLKDVAQILATEEMPVEVEGYTDNLPISTLQFPSNWELSSARASSVVRLFIAQGVEAERLKAIGHADNAPLASNDSAEGRARNRRVTVTALVREPDSSGD